MQPRALIVGARVAWTKQGEGAHLAGVRFESITDAQKAWLARVVSAGNTPGPRRV